MTTQNRINCPNCGHEIFNCGHNEKRGCIECECKLDQHQALEKIVEATRRTALLEAAQAMCTICRNGGAVSSSGGRFVHEYGGVLQVVCDAGPVHALLAEVKHASV